MASYSSAINLQLPEVPRLQARGNEAVYAEFQTIYNAIRYLIAGLQNGAVPIPGTASWGGITGTLSSQTDLQSALNGKFPIPVGSTSQYLRGDGTLATYLAATGVTAGSYTNANITVGNDGRITAAASGSGGGGTGGYMPMVNGDVPPTLMYEEDGSLIAYTV